ncbi:hypothetical protein BU14_2951s0002, partial [Porphyra umbilicalis]
RRRNDNAGGHALSPHARAHGRVDAARNGGRALSSPRHDRRRAAARAPRRVGGGRPLWHRPPAAVRGPGDAAAAQGAAGIVHAVGGAAVAARAAAHGRPARVARAAPRGERAPRRRAPPRGALRRLCGRV